MKSFGTVRERRQTKIYALVRALGKIDRIMSSDPKVTVRFDAVQGIDYPAWNDGQNITLNAKRFDDLGTKEGLVTVLGANYHELSHVLYTPRHDTSLARTVKAYKLQTAFNMLEDQRIETLFTARYRPSSRYFTAAVVKFIIGNKEFWKHAHLLTHGRRYLPLEIRDGFKDLFEGTQEQRERGERIIDNYRLLNVDKDGPAAEGLLKQFSALLDELNQKPKTEDDEDEEDLLDEEEKDSESDHQEGFGGQGSTSPTQESDSERARQQTEEQDEVEEAGEDGSGFWEEEDDDDSEDEDESESGNDEFDEEDETESEESDDEGEGDDDEESSGGWEDNEDEESDDDNDSRSRGTTHGESDAGNDADGEADDEELEGAESPSNEAGNSDESFEVDLEDYLHDALSAVLDSKEVKNEISHIRSSVNDPENFDVDEFDEIETHEYEILSHVQSAARSTAREFAKLQGDIQPSWIYGSDHGRLNVSRAMENPDDLDEIWDEWDEGREQDSGLEICILLDTSYSMYGDKIVDATNSMWIIRRACEELEATVSVLTFDSFSKRYLGRQENVKSDRVAIPANLGGSTNPTEAIRAARRILGQSSKAIKILVMVTDGGWNGKQNEISDLLFTTDGYRICIGIGSGQEFPRVDTTLTEEFHLRKTIANANEIAPLVSVAVDDLVRANIGIQR